MKKSILDISWLVDESTYRQGVGFSYSTVARFVREGFRKIKNLFSKIDSPSLTFGSLVDTIITGTQEKVDQNFFVAKFPKISDNLQTIALTIFKTAGSQYLRLQDVPEDYIHKIAIDNNYYAGDNWRKLRLKNILEGCSEYYDLLKIAGNKRVISEELLLQANRTVDELKTNEYTKFFFAKNNPFDNIERVYQAKFKGEYLDIPIRCMFDLLLVDHNNKTITPVDLKTSYHAEEDFEESFAKWCYLYQAQMYAEILKQNIRKDDYFKDFKILDYRFIVINKETLTPLVWLFPLTFCELDLIDKKTNEIYPNWRKVIQKLKHYLEDKPKYPVEATELNVITRVTPYKKDNI